jgi:hypothetical protein
MPLSAITETNSPTPSTPAFSVPSPAPLSNIEDPSMQSPTMPVPHLMPAPLKRSQSQASSSTDARRPTNVGLGSNPLSGHPNIRSASAGQVPMATSPSSLAPDGVAHRAVSAPFAQSQTEVILYAYAQLVGTLTLAPASASAGSGVAPAPGLLALRRQLRAAQAVGGGRMDLALSFQPGPPRSLACSRLRVFLAAAVGAQPRRQPPAHLEECALPQRTRSQPQMDTARLGVSASASESRLVPTPAGQDHRRLTWGCTHRHCLRDRTSKPTNRAAWQIPRSRCQSLACSRVCSLSTWRWRQARRGAVSLGFVLPGPPPPSRGD